jgi:hypothetical protein
MASATVWSIEGPHRSLMSDASVRQEASRSIEMCLRGDFIAQESSDSSVGLV